MMAKFKKSTQSFTFPEIALAYSVPAGLMIAGTFLLSGPATAEALQNKDKFKPYTPQREATIPCPEYGTRFFRSAGSSYCVKIEGRVRGEAEIRQQRSSDDRKGSTKFRADIGFDVRTQTDYGPFRVVVNTRGLQRN